MQASPGTLTLNQEIRSLLLRIPEQGLQLKLWLLMAHQCELMTVPVTQIIRCLAAPMCDSEAAVYMHGTAAVAGHARAPRPAHALSDAVLSPAHTPSPSVYFLDQLADLIGQDAVLAVLRARASGTPIVEACTTAAACADTGLASTDLYSSLRRSLCALTRAAGGQEPSFSNESPSAGGFGGAMSGTSGLARAGCIAGAGGQRTCVKPAYDADSGIWTTTAQEAHDGGGAGGGVCGAQVAVSAGAAAATAAAAGTRALRPLPPAALPTLPSIHTPRTVNDARLQTVNVAVHALPWVLGEAEAVHARVAASVDAMLDEVAGHDRDLASGLRMAMTEMHAHTTMLAQAAVFAARALDAHRELNMQTATAVLGNMSTELPAGAHGLEPVTPPPKPTTPPISSSHIQHMRAQVGTCGDVGILGLLEWASVTVLPAQKVHIAEAFARTSQFLCRPETSMRAAIQAIRGHPHCGEPVLRALADAELLTDLRKAPGA